jgi:hypothetical protein
MIKTPLRGELVEPMPSRVQSLSLDFLDIIHTIFIFFFPEL